MAKKKPEKVKKNNIKPAHSFIYKLSEAILVYVAIDYLLRSDDQFEIGLVAFALIWIATDVALWVYQNVVQPSALAIIKNSK